MRIILLVAALAFSAAALAQDYPARPVKIVVPYPPASGVDHTARLIAEKLRARWGQAVLVENKSGAAGNIGAEFVAKSIPDGYTLLYVPPGPLVINKSLYAKLAYDPDTFLPVSLVTLSPNVLIVHPKVPAASVQQLIAYAKANPDRLNYASAGNGGTQHLSSELFKAMAGIRITHVPYKGTGPALADLLGGQVDMLMSEIGLILPHILAGRLRVLAVGSATRNPVLPEIPAMSEVLPGFLTVSWNGVVAPGGTPSAIVNRISGAVAEAAKQPDIKKRALELSVEMVGSTPAEMTQFLKQERERWGNVIRVSGATPD